MKKILAIATLIALSTASAQPVVHFAKKSNTNNLIKLITLDKNEVIDLTTKDGERWHVEDIEEGLIKIPNVKISKDKLVLTAVNGKLPLQEVMMSAKMIGPDVVIGGGGDMGGGDK